VEFGWMRRNEKGGSARENSSTKVHIRANLKFFSGAQGKGFSW
jgi:hypothetical protein